MFGVTIDINVNLCFLFLRYLFDNSFQFVTFKSEHLKVGLFTIKFCFQSHRKYRLGDSSSKTAFGHRTAKIFKNNLGIPSRGKTEGFFNLSLQNSLKSFPQS